MANKTARKIAANYRVKEPLSCLKLRVKIVQQRPLLAELLEDEEDTRDSNFLKEEDRIFSWQEKVFSPFEISFYGEEKNCLAEYQKKYHRQIKEKNVDGSQLYSYTENDSYYAGKELFTKRYKTKLSIKNESALPALQNRKPFSERYNKAVVDDYPNDIRIRSNHYVYKERSTMYIMVELSRKNDTFASFANEDAETVLCTVSYDKLRQILSVDPDFTSDQCYTVTNTSGIKFTYSIEHVSEKQSSLELQQQQNDTRREIKERQMQKEAELFRGLQLTMAKIQKIFVKLDILSAYEFAYNGLFVTYYIDLPEHWSTNEKEKLFGRTQKCNLQNKTACFSYAIEISLDFQLNNSIDRNKISPLWPRLLISVSSLDKWTRYCTEGYAALPLPSLPGSYEFNVPTWRPVGSIINSLRRFFTGGTYELEDITYCSIPAGHEGKTLNKSRLNVVSSGYVKININIVCQNYVSSTNSYLPDYCETLSTDALVNNVENIFEQFKAARERMIQIKNMNF